jgi:hypothetical protein
VRVHGSCISHGHEDDEALDHAPVRNGRRGERANRTGRRRTGRRADRAERADTGNEPDDAGHEPDDANEPDRPVDASADAEPAAGSATHSERAADSDAIAREREHRQRRGQRLLPLTIADTLRA